MNVEMTGWERTNCQPKLFKVQDSGAAEIREEDDMF